MKLTSAEYKEIARDALKGSWGKAIGAMLLAACLGAFGTSLYFITHFMFIMSIAIRVFESLPIIFWCCSYSGSYWRFFSFSQAGRHDSDTLILIWRCWTEGKPLPLWYCIVFLWSGRVCT